MATAVTKTLTWKVGRTWGEFKEQKLEEDRDRSLGNARDRLLGNANELETLKEKLTAMSHIKSNSCLH
jgi:hypothetical protein